MGEVLLYISGCFMKKLILASSSPRRKELLEQIGLEFDIVVSDIEEKVDINLSPEETAKSLAYQKAYDVAKKVGPEKLVLGSDTIVVIDNEILGKPQNEDDIYQMLRKLSNTTHTVITGVCLYSTYDNSFIVESDTSFIKIREISDVEIAAYIKSGEPFDKAGSYAIQGIGAVFVERIEGNYSGIVGLPVYMVAQMLKQYRVNVLE